MIKQLENQLKSVRDATKREQPLIHCITNPISIHGCANMILAVGARPDDGRASDGGGRYHKDSGSTDAESWKYYRCADRVHEAFRADGGERRNSGSAGSGRRIRSKIRMELAWN